MSALQTFSSDRPFRVDVAEIRKELTRLWKEAAAPTGAEPAPVTRATLHNLVVWSAGDSDEEVLKTTIARIAEAHPARVILLRVDARSEKDRLEAMVAARCRIPASGPRQVCSEEITIRAGISTTEHLPGLASALAASDLPVSLYVDGPLPFGDPALRRLADGADRLILDSAALPGRELGRLAELDASLKMTSLGDINWRRLRPWQDLVAAFFDSPLCLPLLPSLARLETYGGAASEAAARLLCGWASAALDRPLGFRFEADEAAGSQLRRIQLIAEEPASATFIVDADQSSGALESRVEMEGTCPLPHRLRVLACETWQLICGQLERVGRDRLYESALCEAAALP